MRGGSATFCGTAGKYRRNDGTKDSPSGTHDGGGRLDSRQWTLQVVARLVIGTLAPPGIPPPELLISRKGQRSDRKVEKPGRQQRGQVDSTHSRPAGGAEAARAPRPRCPCQEHTARVWW